MFARRIKYTGFWLFPVLFSLILAASSIANAQVLYGSLTGTVTDTSGAIVPGAQVSAVENQTGVKQDTVSDSAGIYRFAALLPGTYKVTIAAQGFGTQETSGVVVNRNEIARVDAQLKVATTTQSVTVTTAPP